MVATFKQKSYTYSTEKLLLQHILKLKHAQHTDSSSCFICITEILDGS